MYLSKVRMVASCLPQLPSRLHNIFCEEGLSCAKVFSHQPHKVVRSNAYDLIHDTRYARSIMHELFAQLQLGRT